MQTIASVLIMIAYIAFVIALNVSSRKETKRRRFLPVEEQERLKHDDAVWSQRFGF